jgi:hypothetical protein
MNEEQTKTLQKIKAVLEEQRTKVQTLFIEIEKERDALEDDEGEKQQELDDQLDTLEELENHLDLTVDDCAGL